MNKVIRMMVLGLVVFSTHEMSAQRHHRHDDDREYRRYDRDDDHDDDRHYRKSHYKYKKQKHHHHRKHRWASSHQYQYNNHVYFPDYEMFYDPYRDGYVCQSRGRWVFSKSVPSAYLRVDFGRARMVMVDDVPLDRHPERHYRVYEQRYPRNPKVNLNISF